MKTERVALCMIYLFNSNILGLCTYIINLLCNIFNILFLIYIYYIFIIYIILFIIIILSSYIYQNRFDQKSFCSKNRPELSRMSTNEHALLLIIPFRPLL